MASGGRRSSTWAKGEKPPVQRPKGAKNNKTRLKESLGLQNWEGLKKFIETSGATKLIKEMRKLKGQQYVYAMQAMTEFVKPKLQRTDAKVSANINLSDQPVTFE